MTEECFGKSEASRSGDVVNFLAGGSPCQSSALFQHQRWFLVLTKSLQPIREALALLLFNKYANFVYAFLGDSDKSSRVPAV